MSRVVLITGASSGIGAAAAIKFAKEGDWVAIHYNQNRDGALYVKEEISKIPGGRAEIFQSNFENPSDVYSLCENVKSSLGDIEVLVNNAGITNQKLITDFSLCEWNQILSVNLTAAFVACQAVIPSMVSSKKGKIINISSIYGMTGGSCEVPYSAAKAGVIGFTKALALELGPSNIQVNCVAPGVVDTKMNKNHSEQTINELCAQTPLGRLGTAEEMASVIFFLASSDADFITGQVISPNGGIVT